MAGQILSRNPDDDFLSRENFDEVIDKICQKLSSRKHYLEKKDFGGSDLKLILQHTDIFYQAILDYFSSYEFSSSPLNKIQIITNKKRDIYIATWAERIIYMMAQNTLARKSSPYLIENLFSFRKGYGPYKARDSLLRYLKKYETTSLYVFQGDVKSYGDNIDQDILLKTLSEKLFIDSTTSIYQTIQASIKAKFISEGALQDLKSGVPSGSPLVPVLENIYLSDLDQKISRLPEMFYTRYGDDFVFINPHLENISKAKEILYKELEEKRLEIKDEKIKFTRLTTKVHLKDPLIKTYFQWIGFSFHATGLSTSKTEYFKKMKASLHHEVNHYFNKIKSLPQTETNDLVMMISEALKAIYGKNQQIRRFLTETTDQKFIQQFIITERKFIKRMMMFHLVINSKSSWKLIRQIGFGMDYFK